MLSPGESASCVFCDIVVGTVAAHVVGESDAALAFLGHAPATPGHMLVVPKMHARDLLDITADALGAVLALAQIIARRQVEMLPADGVSLFQSTGAAAGQDVFHVHVHLIPRRTGDGLVQPWRGRTTPDADLAATARALRA